MPTHDYKSPEEIAARFAAIFESGVFAIVTTNDKGIIEDYNPSAEKMFGHPRDAAIGNNVQILMPEPFQRTHDVHLDTYLESGNKKIIGTGRETVGLKSDGSRFPINLTVSEVRLPDRRLFTAMIEDISARTDAEQRVRELQFELTHVARVSAMGEMASALAHELSQPLTAISNYASAARRVLDEDRAHAPKDATALILKAGEQALRAGEIIRRLRQFIELGETERAWQDMKSAVEEAAKLGLVGAQTRGITYHLTAPDDLPKVFIDRIQIQQVFQNLVRNAVDAMTGWDGEKSIEVHLSRASQNQLQILVDDTGPGLDPQVKDRLFKPFVTTKPNGMGIGLSVSRNIVEQHGGEISACDRPEGGARFQVRLPITEK